MYSWVNLDDLIRWTGANLLGPLTDFPVRVISTDSRTIKAGDVFLALKGETMDGHDYIQEAASRGAIAIISEKEARTACPVLLVKDSLKALIAIGEAQREKFKGKTFAITGSAGKSSTKEMLGTLCGDHTVRSPASFNNLMGVSRTLYLVQDDTQNLVLEMGMNNFGEIAELCERFKPQGGLITNIGDAHIGKLGGQEGIFKAKKELFDYLSANTSLGIALNQDDPLVVRAFHEAFGQKKVPLLRYSTKSAADVFVKDSKLNPATCGLVLSLVIQGQEHSAELPIFGLHHAQNAAASIAGALLMGQTTKDILARVSNIRAASHRGEIHQKPDGSTVIDECYNANPTAMISSLQSVALLPASRRRLFVLGEMRELGEFSAKLHEEVGEALGRMVGTQPYEIVAVGKDCASLVAGVKKFSKVACHHVLTAADAIPVVQKVRRPGDIIYVKASRGVTLDKVIAAL